MNNPNPNYASSPSYDEDENFDHEKFITHVFDVLTVRRAKIREWLERQGLQDVRVRDLPPRNAAHAFEVLAIRGQEDGPRNKAQVRALLVLLAAEMGMSVEPDGLRAAIWDDRLAIQFRLSI